MDNITILFYSRGADNFIIHPTRLVPSKIGTFVLLLVAPK